MCTKRHVGFSFIALVFLTPARPALCETDFQSVELVDDEVARQTRVYTTWKTFTARDGLPHNSIRAICVFGDQVWVGTADGLALREGGSWRSWTRKDGLPAQVISTIAVDPRTRDVWLGTWGQGLVRFSAGRFDQFEQMGTGLAGNLIFDVVVEKDRVWAATNAGVSLFDVRRDTWELFFARRADQPETIITSLILKGKDLYAGTWRGPVQRFDPKRKTWTSLRGRPEQSSADGARSPGLKTAPKPGATGSLPARALAGPGAPGPVTPHHTGWDSLLADASVGIAVGGQSLWWATQARLFHGNGQVKWDDRVLSLRSPSEGFIRLVRESLLAPTLAGSPSYDFIYCLASPSDTQAWLGTDRGVRVLSDWASDTWITYGHGDGTPEGTVTLSRGGRTLAAQTLESTIPDNRVRCIAFDQDEVWIGTVNGLALGTDEKRWDELQATTDISAPEPKRRAESALPAVQQQHSAAMAVYGPRTRTITLPGTRARRTVGKARPDLLAVQIALEQANRASRRQSEFPVELVLAAMGYDRYGWGTKEDDLVVFAAKPKVAGIVGYIGPTDLIADAAVLRTEIPFVSVATSPLPLDEPTADNPFVFHCYGDGPRRHRLLIDYLFDKRGYTRLAALRTPGKTTDRHLDWWSSHARTRGHPLVAELPCPLEATAPSRSRLRTTLDALRRSRPNVVLTWCDMHTSANILRQMREAGMDQLFVGGKEIVNDEFASLVGADPGAVIAAYPTQRLAGSRSLPTFAREYAEQNVRGGVATPPGINAYLSFDAADHLIEAIRTVGPDREAVRRALEQMSRSATGELHYERLREPGKTTLAHLEAGHWTFQLIP